MKHTKKRIKFLFSNPNNYKEATNLLLALNIPFEADFCLFQFHLRSVVWAASFFSFYLTFQTNPKLLILELIRWVKFDVHDNKNGAVFYIKTTPFPNIPRH